MSKVKSGAFTYSPTSGLCYTDEPRCSSEEIQERLASNPHLLTRKYLRAQLAHYEISPLTGVKGVLEERLRNAIAEGKTNTQPATRKHLEEVLRLEWESWHGGERHGRGWGEGDEDGKEKQTDDKDREEARWLADQAGIRILLRVINQITETEEEEEEEAEEEEEGSYPPRDARQ